MLTTIIVPSLRELLEQIWLQSAILSLSTYTKDGEQWQEAPGE